MNTIINVEPNDNEGYNVPEPPRNNSEQKRSSPIWFWLFAILIVAIVIFSVLSCYFCILIIPGINYGTCVPVGGTTTGKPNTDCDCKAPEIGKGPTPTGTPYVTSPTPVISEITTTETPQITVPDVTSPTPDIPETTTTDPPQITVPDVTSPTPDIPEITTTDPPQITVPDVTSPTPAIPEITTTEASLVTTAEVTSTTPVFPEITTTEEPPIPTTTTPIPVTSPPQSKLIVMASKTWLHGTRDRTIYYYDKVVFNDQNSLNSSSGVWTAPKDGTYEITIWGTSAIQLQIDGLTVGLNSLPDGVYGENQFREGIMEGYCSYTSAPKKSTLKKGTRVSLFNPGLPFKCLTQGHSSTHFIQYDEDRDVGFYIFEVL